MKSECGGLRAEAGGPPQRPPRSARQILAQLEGSVRNPVTLICPEKSVRSFGAEKRRRRRRRQKQRLEGQACRRPAVTSEPLHCSTPRIKMQMSWE
ncbi:hypothetical protein GN956_G5609 [Arapaima gigas]